MMVPLRLFLFSICATRAARIQEDSASSVDLAVDDELSRDNATLQWTKPYLLVVSNDVADAKFRSEAEPVLMEGEVVEMAFWDDYRDWLLFTNFRTLEVDGEATAWSGYGKTAVPNKITYISNLWRKAMAGQKRVAVITASSSFDKDVEVSLLPSNKQYAFSSKIGDKAHFAIGEYLRNKVTVFGKVAVPGFCSSSHEVLGWDKIKAFGHESSTLCQKNSDERIAFQHAVAMFDVPGIGVSSPSRKSVQEILGGGIGMIGKDETVLFKWTETWSLSRRYDDMIVTDKQIITVDRKLAKKVMYQSFPIPTGLAAKFFQNIDTWVMSTAQRKGVDRDCELSATMTQFAKTFDFQFDKNAVSTANQFDYHTQLQKQILKFAGSLEAPLTA